MRTEPDNAVPKEIASAVNLLAHPAAGMMALSAVSIGVASQVFGVWLGALTGAAEVAQRIAASMEPDALAKAPAAREPAPTAPTEKPKLATVTVLADVRKPAPKAVKTAPQKKAPAVAAPVAVAPVAAAPAAVAQALDDLKLIAGVGPKLEKMLNGMGVSAFAQIAAWTADEAAEFDRSLSLAGRISRDRWVEQAKSLARGSVADGR